MKDKIAKWFKLGLWSKEMVQAAAEKGIITKRELTAILKMGA